MGFIVGYNVLSDVVFAVSCGRGINCPHPMVSCRRPLRSASTRREREREREREVYLRSRLGSSTVRSIDRASIFDWMELRLEVFDLRLDEASTGSTGSRRWWIDWIGLLGSLAFQTQHDDLQDHIIICGFGRVGHIIAQLLSERLIPFVALDVRRIMFEDLIILVVPETLEPSLQLAAAVLAQAHDRLKLESSLSQLSSSSAKLPMSEIKAIINKFRSHHLSELTELSEASGGSLGYGYSRIMSKPKSQPFDSSDDNQITEGTLVI
ncbi:hypothetical protein HYC85_006172 [Camellia sinensis]|uniref:RCK N-terminal domain-containing protein n=1 Tax=Camellia sinensis TaxID=4442 RepID=A0A7J7HMY3_CAMSI|nr:hypothetical protein HYC85_006172 [Camellia sinensis]